MPKNMHKTQWIKHAAHRWGFDQTWAEKRWLNAKATTPEDKWNYQGPNEELRLPMPTEDYMDGSQPTIKLKVEDPFGEEGEAEMKMDQTLSDLADFVRDFEDTRGIYWGTLDEMWFTTVHGMPLPMNVTLGKLLLDGLISDGSKLLVKAPPPP